MALTHSYLIQQGYATQALKLAKQLKLNHNAEVAKKARLFSSIPGVVVNDSFYSSMEKSGYSTDEITKALSDLGVNFKLIEGKKWYQFWLDNDDVKLFNAIKLI